jgi:hypothetical protein
MKPRDAFGVVVRSAGLLLLMFGLYELMGSVYVMLTPDKPHAASAAVAAIYGAVSVVGSLVLLKGAPRLVRFCYGEGEREP